MSDNGVFGTDPEEEQRLRAQTLQAARSLAEGGTVGNVPTVVGNLLAMYEKDSAIDVDRSYEVWGVRWRDGDVVGVDTCTGREDAKESVRAAEYEWDATVVRRTVWVGPWRVESQPEVQR